MSIRVDRHIAVAAAAVVWLTMGVLTGPVLSVTPLRVCSVAGSVAALAAAAYEPLIWRWSSVRRLTGVPLLAGTWRGTIVSSYVHRGGAATAPMPAVARITQTGSKITVTVLTAESSSRSSHARLRRLPDQRWSLSWFYENTPRVAVRHRSERHCGWADAAVGGAGAGLVGEFFTDRLTRGEVRFDEWSPTMYATAEAALRAADFQAPRPFADRRP